MNREISYDKVKDSGERQEFKTGSRRDTRRGKGRFDLVPPHALRRLAQLYENGAEKYGDRNWEKGQPLGRYIDSALRHVNCHLLGDISEDHLIQAAWNLFAYVETEARIKKRILPESLNDMTHLGELDGRTTTGFNGGDGSTNNTDREETKREETERKDIEKERRHKELENKYLIEGEFFDKDYNIIEAD